MFFACAIPDTDISYHFSLVCQAWKHADELLFKGIGRLQVRSRRLLWHGISRYFLLTNLIEAGHNVRNVTLARQE